MDFMSKYKEPIFVMEPATPEKKGKRIEFHNHRYSTSDKKEIDYLRKHPDFGMSFTDVPEPQAKGA